MRPADPRHRRSRLARSAVPPRLSRSVTPCSVSDADLAGRHPQHLPDLQTALREDVEETAGYQLEVLLAVTAEALGGLAKAFADDREGAEEASKDGDGDAALTDMQLRVGVD